MENKYNNNNRSEERVYIATQQHMRQLRHLWLYEQRDPSYSEN